MNVNEKKFIGQEQAKGDNMEARMARIEAKLEELSVTVKLLSDEISDKYRLKTHDNNPIIGPLSRDGI